MDPEHLEQMKRLVKFRESAQNARSATEPLEAAEDEARASELVKSHVCPRDPLIYPGLYAPSGFDIMNILVRVKTRPNAEIDIGFVDSSCALLLCDLKGLDTPIVYCSEAFESLTGYASSEILGKNCRFLQSPDGKVSKGVKRTYTDDKVVFELKNKISARQEAQTMIVNYKKGGIPFENILTTIPIRWDSDEVRFMVGFQVDSKTCFL